MLKFIFGRSGYGKTEYVFNEINELVKNGEKNIILFTPEQYNFTAERKLLGSLGESGINSVLNLSFSRLYNEVSRHFGENFLPILSKSAKAVLMKKAIDNSKDEFLLFKKNIGSSSFVNSVVKIYDEMKSCDISFEEMKDLSKDIDKEILCRKLHDIAVITEEYEKLISGKYYDSSSELRRLYETLLNCDFLDGKTIFIDGFNGFVANEYKIIELMIKKAKNVSITFVTDSYKSDDKYDLFAYVNGSVKTLSYIAKKNNIEITYDDISCSKNLRANNEDIKTAERNVFERVPKSVTGDAENVSVYNAKNIYDECNFTSIEIKKLLRNGYKASDIAVMCRDINKYKSQILYSFKKYEVPYFEDERQSINTQPLVVFIQYLLRSVIYSFRSDDVLSLAKTGLTDISQKDISRLENYIYLWKIDGIKKWSKPFSMSTKGFAEEISENDQKKIDRLNESRDILFDKINHFKNSTKNATAKDISRSVYNAIMSFNVNRHLKDIVMSLNEMNKSVLSTEQERVWDLVMEMLNSIATVFDDLEMSVKEYLDLFNIMISNEDIGVIPQGIDNVQFGQADRMRLDNPKVLFILGANEGEFPQSVSSGGLLSEADRVVLKRNNFELYSFGETLSLQEKYFAYMAVSAPSDKLFVSYTGNGLNNAPSIIVSGILSTFVDLKVKTIDKIDDIDFVESEESAFELMAERFSENTEFSESIKKYYSNDERYKTVENLVENKEILITDKSSATELFKKDMYLSASRLEDFYKCRFRYFCKFGLGAKPREVAEMDAMHTGTVIHFVLENVLKEAGTKELSAMNGSQIRILVDKYLREYLESKMGDTSEFTTRFKYLFLRLSKMLYTVVSRLALEFSQSKFEAKAFELPIDKEAEVKPIKIPLVDGGSVQVRGTIDRVDLLNNGNEQYVRVVDYKSGVKNFKLSDILYGLNLQMFIYLFTLCKNEGSSFSGIPAGVLYMHSEKGVKNTGRNPDENALKQDENKEFKMKGVVLYDEEHNILNSMEEEVKGNFIPAKMNKNGDISGDIATLSELGAISKKIESLVAEMGVSLHSGEIYQNPVNGKYHENTCEYCDFSSVCANKKEITTREIESLKTGETLEILKEE